MPTVHELHMSYHNNCQAIMVVAAVLKGHPWFRRTGFENMTTQLQTMFDLYQLHGAFLGFGVSGKSTYPSARKMMLEEVGFRLQGVGLVIQNNQWGINERDQELGRGVWEDQRYGSIRGLDNQKMDVWHMQVKI